MTRTLVVYLHGIGDNIMLSGVLKEYCRLHPDEATDLVVLNPACAAIWQNNPLVQSVTVYPGGQPYFWNPFKFYFSHQFAVRRYIDTLNQDGRYHRAIFPAIQTLPEIIYHFTGTYGPHKINRICADLGVPEKLYPYDLYPSAQELSAAEELVAKFGGKPLAVLHPFSGHTLKRLSNEGFGAILNVMRKKGMATLVVGAPNDKSRLDPAWETESAFGLSFGVLIGILKHAAVFAGTDSAIAHLAAFANVPRLAVFSPKLEPGRYLPISERSRIEVIRIKQGREASSLEAVYKFLG
jgi:ADP-heptose:LPS heptosyltransferase